MQRVSRQAPAIAAAASPPQVAALPADWPNRSCSERSRAGGIDWHIQRSGSGPGVLLLHGTGAGTHTWRDVLPRLAQSNRVIAPDLPGHAFSSSLPGGVMSVTHVAAALDTLLATLGETPAAVVAHSAAAGLALSMRRQGLLAPLPVICLNPAFGRYGGPLHPLFAGIAGAAAASRTVARLLARQAAVDGAVARVLRNTGSSLPASAVAEYRRVLTEPRHVQATLSMMANWRLPASDDLLCDIGPAGAPGRFRRRPRGAATAGAIAGEAATVAAVDRVGQPRPPRPRRGTAASRCHHRTRTRDDRR